MSDSNGRPTSSPGGQSPYRSIYDPANRWAPSGAAPPSAAYPSAQTNGPTSHAQPQPGPPPAQFPGVRVGYGPVPPAAATSPQPRRQAPNKTGPGWAALILAMALTALASVGTTIALTGGTDTSGSAASAIVATPQSGTTATVRPQTGSPDWEAVAEAVRPATVSIQTDGGGEMGTGSGVIIDGLGHIITNHHVVSNVLEDGNITVNLNDGRLYAAEVVGTDKTTDLGVIRLIDPPQDLVAANLSSSESLRVGQPVMAVGSPLGLSDTVTTGVISALDRPVVVSGQTEPDAEAVVTNAIQIDASINPGNSGGPLFDETGSVVGINSSIASLASSSESAGSIGLGFAIPIDLAKYVAGQIIENGSVQHSVLGVQIMSGSANHGTETVLGAAVAEVVGGSAAEEAGLQSGDVIVGIGGHQVVSGPSLTGYVRRYRVGETVTLDVIREGQLMQVDVTLRAKQ